MSSGFNNCVHVFPPHYTIEAEPKPGIGHLYYIEVDGFVNNWTINLYSTQAQCAGNWIQYPANETLSNIFYHISGNS